MEGLVCADNLNKWISHLQRIWHNNIVARLPDSSHHVPEINIKPIFSWEFVNVSEFDVMLVYWSIVMYSTYTRLLTLRYVSLCREYIWMGSNEIF